MKFVNPLSQIRFLKRLNGFVILNISGLALGLASVIFISLWIKNELSYDRFNEKADRIYRVESLLNFTGEPFVWTVVPGPAPAAMKEDFPEIEESVIMKSGYQDAIDVNGELFNADNLYYSTDSYFQIFTRGLLYGSPGNLLEVSGSVVISRRIAEKLYGNENPVGKTMLLNNDEQLTVTGVMENPRPNSHLKIDYLISFSSYMKSGQYSDYWGTFNYICYILLKEGADGALLNDKLDGYIQSKDKGRAGRLFLNPLTRIYLYPNPGFDSMVYPSKENSPISKVILFGLIGILLLVIASINFINLSTAYATERSKEIGIRKVNGAGRNNLVVQLFTESLLQTFIAMVTALILVILLLPVFVRISGLSISTASLFIPSNLLIYLLLTLVTGIIAGFYPAVVLSSFRPVKVIKPQPEDALQGAGLRKVLVVFQFILAIIFIFCIMVMNRQLNFMQGKDLGFDTEQIMVIYPKRGKGNADRLAEQIKDTPGVTEVAIGGNVPVSMGNWMTIDRWDGNNSEKSLKFHRMDVDDNYIDLLGFDLIMGREFPVGAATTDIIINEAAIREMEIDDPLGKSIWFNSVPHQIIGVVRDFHFHKLKDEILPVIFQKPEEWWSKQVFVKLEPGNHFQVVDKITALINENFPGFPARYIFLDEEVNRYYEEERRLNTLTNSATFLIILISCIGLFSLTAFTVRRKRREIGIRKAHGASFIEILLLLHREFSLLILLAAFIALPSAYYVMSRWLMSYAYHIPVSAGFFFLSILSIIFIASLTIIYHTLKASGLNPAVTLRNE